MPGIELWQIIPGHSGDPSARLGVIACGAGGYTVRTRTGAREAHMRITDVLRGKGTQVVTVPPDTKVRRLLEVLAEHRIGAVVVSHDGTSVDGIVSERDIVLRAFAKRGAAVMSEPVTAIYTAEVHTITPDTSLDEVMLMMTERRVRHAPVVVDGVLRGIVSIGDVVENRIDELGDRAGASDRLHHRHPLARRRVAQERVALVTGSSRGLGAAIARRLAGEGFAVAVNGLPGDDGGWPPVGPDHP